MEHFKHTTERGPDQTYITVLRPSSQPPQLLLASYEKRASIQTRIENSNALIKSNFTRLQMSS